MHAAGHNFLLQTRKLQQTAKGILSSYIKRSEANSQNFAETRSSSYEVHVTALLSMMGRERLSGDWVKHMCHSILPLQDGGRQRWNR